MRMRLERDISSCSLGARSSLLAGGDLAEPACVEPADEVPRLGLRDIVAQLFQRHERSSRIGEAGPSVVPCQVAEEAEADHRLRRGVDARDGFLDPAKALADVTARGPIARQRRDQADGDFAIARLLRPLERGTQVADLGVEPLQRSLLRVHAGRVVELLGHSGEMSSVLLVERCSRRVGASVRCEFTNRLQHPVARLAVGIDPSPQQALVHERSDTFEDIHPERAAGVADRLGVFEPTTTDEHAQATEQRLLVRRKQVVATLDSRPQRPLALVGIAGPARQQAKAAAEPRHHRLWSQCAHPGGSELDRERQAVQLPDDLRDRGRVLLRECRTTGAPPVLGPSSHESGFSGHPQDR